MTASDVTSAGLLLLRSALALAARGWHVFPCEPGGKRPALRGNWQDHATTHGDRIRAWWRRPAYNIGIACGPSGLVVIDLDVPRGGRPGAAGADCVRRTLPRARRSPPTADLAVDTPSGGCHLYYAAPAGRVRNSAGRLGPLIDIRATAGT